VEKIKMFNFKVIYILWLRQIKKYFRSNARMISSLGQPLLFLVAFWFGFGPIFAKAGGGNYLDFLVPGIITMTILFTAIFTGIEVIWDRQFGFLKETLVAPVSRIDIFIGRNLGGATVALIQGTFLFLITLLLGFRPTNWAMMPLVLLFMFMIGFLFTSLGTAIASLLDDMHAFPLITNFLIMPLFFLSGALFPLENLPGAIGAIADFNPVSYGVDGLRASLVGVAHFGMLLDFVVLFFGIMVISVVGGYLFSKIEV
jgi:ABC-2 type transport system permease protein